MSTYKPKILVNQLFMLIKTAQIHDPSNRAFTQPLTQFQALLAEMISEEGPLKIEVVDLNLYLNEEKIRTDISTFATFRFLQGEFENKGVGGIRFLETPSVEELTTFLRLAARTNDPSQIGADAFNAAMVDKEISSIEFLERTQKKSVSKESLSDSVGQKRRALKSYVKAMDVVKQGALNPSAPQALAARKAKRLVYNLVDICLSEGFSFLGLSSIKNYDEYTFNHSVNVCVIAIGFGKNLGLTKKQIGELGIAGLYHDYGKVNIPREILNKPGKFNPDEWEVMKSHPLKSVKALLNMDSFQETDIKKLIAAFEHHRNYDCTGYPQTGVKKDLNFYSRVVAIADAYDAMTTNRVYQRAMLPTVALQILIDNSGTKFDPLLVKAFVNTVGIYPVGSFVRLNNNMLGVVAKVHTDPGKLARPVIKVVIDAAGKKLSNGPEADLASEAGASLEITTVLRPEDYQVNVAHYLFGDALDTSKAATA